MRYFSLSILFIVASTVCYASPVYTKQGISISKRMDEVGESSKTAAARVHFQDQAAGESSKSAPQSSVTFNVKKGFEGDFKIPDKLWKNEKKWGKVLVQVDGKPGQEKPEPVVVWIPGEEGMIIKRIKIGPEAEFGNVEKELRAAIESNRNHLRWAHSSGVVYIWLNSGAIPYYSGKGIEPALEHYPPISGRQATRALLRSLAVESRGMTIKAAIEAVPNHNDKKYWIYADMNPSETYIKMKHFVAAFI